MFANIKLFLSLVWEQVTSLFFILLLVSAFASFWTGQKMDGYIILAIMLVNFFLDIIQEFRASKASAKLLKLVEGKVYVLRGEELVEVKVSELKKGDMVHLVPGSIVPVDIIVSESEGVLVDDSVRTGETAPYEVDVEDKVFAGSTVAMGRLVGVVLSGVGASSLSKYRKKLETLKKWSSFGHFTERVIRYVFIFSLAALALSMIVLVFILGKYTLVNFFVFSIAMLVGVVPEVLPLIITIILTRESLHLAEHKIIVKRLSALQGLGAMKFLLVDKTGTITENKLKVFSVYDHGEFWECSNSITTGAYERSPMDAAYDNALNASIGIIKTGTSPITHFEPFRRDKGYELFTLKDGTRIARGILGDVLGLCSNPDVKIVKRGLEYETSGMRVVGLAKGLAGEWHFSGFVAFNDPIKATAKDSIRSAHAKGICVKILTGDSLSVAVNVATELGLIHAKETVIALDTRKVAELSDKELAHAVVFAKCTPEDKLELIDRYLKIGTVAFMGDGINDALALKRADIGIAVDNASDIAKESADLILLEKDLKPVLKSVGVGRKALRNILTYIMYTLSGNAGTFLSLTIASFFYPVLPMLPIQILLNNLLTDLPLMLIITDNPDEYALRHVPHFEPGKLMKRIIAFGLVSSIFDLIYFTNFYNTDVMQFQTGWFVFSVLTELALILSIRSSRFIFKAPAVSVPLAFGIIISAFLPFIFVYSSVLAGMFDFAELPWHTVAFLFYLTLIYIAVNEGLKFFMRKRNWYNKPIDLLHLFSQK